MFPGRSITMILIILAPIATPQNHAKYQEFHPNPKVDRTPREDINCQVCSTMCVEAVEPSMEADAAKINQALCDEACRNGFDGGMKNKNKHRGSCHIGKAKNLYRIADGKHLMINFYKRGSHNEFSCMKANVTCDLMQQKDCEIAESVRTYIKQQVHKAQTFAESILSTMLKLDSAPKRVSRSLAFRCCAETMCNVGSTDDWPNYEMVAGDTPIFFLGKRSVADL